VQACPVNVLAIVEELAARPGARAPNLLARDEARRIAANIVQAARAAESRRLIEVLPKALPLRIQLRTNRFTRNSPFVPQSQT
jgi:hypothetical protein